MLIFSAADVRAHADLEIKIADLTQRIQQQPEPAGLFALARLTPNLEEAASQQKVWALAGPSAAIA